MCRRCDTGQTFYKTLQLYLSFIQVPFSRRHQKPNLALIQVIYQNKFCQYNVNEYCKDSKTYLEELANWKNNLRNTKNRDETLYLVAADVQGLYPNLCRELIKASINTT